MKKNNFKYVYGPVFSWRMGMSLGIDPLTDKEKICNFDCVYCQLGRTKEFYTERKNFVPVEAILTEIKALPPVEIDYYTFSGRGEPTLAKNLGEMIAAVREATGGKIAVITNAALIGQEDVQKDLMLADYILAKLDGCDDYSLARVDVPGKNIRFQKIFDGIKSFRRKFRGRFALQIMFIDENKKYAPAMAKIAAEISPDEVQINTPLRPGGAKPLSQAELAEIKEYFQGLSATTVYEGERREAKPLDEKKTILRHGNFKKKAKSWQA